MLKILGRKTSSNVQKVLWCCSELDIAFERKAARLRRVFHLHHFGLGDVPAVDTRHAAALVVHAEHDLKGLFLGLAGCACAAKVGELARCDSFAEKAHEFRGSAAGAQTECHAAADLVHDAPLEVIVKLLANQVGLRQIRVGNVMMVTTKANAAELQESPEIPHIPIPTVPGMAALLTGQYTAGGVVAPFLLQIVPGAVDHLVV